jgi:hypothetical protein
MEEFEITMKDYFIQNEIFLIIAFSNSSELVVEKIK